MQLANGQLRLSASDLSNHVGCRHLTRLNLRVAHGELKAPVRRDIRLDALRERGADHEEAYVAHLEAAHGWRREVVERGDDAPDPVERTHALMTAGADLIVQGAFESDGWIGYADVLLRTDTPSRLGPWSYEVVDTKLARETKAATVLQLCLYAELIETVQGVLPARLGVVTPLGMEPEWYRTHDYLAYFRRVKAGFVAALDANTSTYPEPTALCEVCRWQPECRGVRRRDDHLSLVAGISTSQRKELVEHEIETVKALAEVALPWPFRPERGAAASYERIREQARVQVVGRGATEPYFELLPVEPERGLGRLPPPSPGDLYFDIEGDRYAGRDGLEYLLGVAYRDGDTWRYRPFWAFDAAGEKAAFEAFVDFVEVCRASEPTLHIYHFDHYEPSALKRLMGRYATREDRIDDWLRHHLFVDLHRVVRESLIAGVERYGLKELEAFYAFERTVPLEVAGESRALLERAIELGQRKDLEANVELQVEGYNRDDCVSTAALHRWLEGVRADQIEAGVGVPRPILEPAETNEKFDERREHIQRLVAALTQDVPVDETARTPAQHARWLLAYCLDYYRREDKVEWWEMFRLMGLDPTEYLYENKALGGLVFEGRVGGTDRAPIHRYRFPPQECAIRKGNLLLPTGERVGEVADLDVHHAAIDIKKMAKTADVHPEAVFEFNHINAKVLEDALIRLAEWTLDQGIDVDGKFRAARDLLLRTSPRLSHGVDLAVGADSLVIDAQHICRHLDRSILPIQGPPGAGKTYLGAEIIVDLVLNGQKVGVTANSHKVIRNLLDAVLEAATRKGVEVRCAAKPGDETDLEDTDIAVVDNESALDAIRGEVHVLGGTKFLWSRQEFADSVDVLVVDEASQLALADALAISGAAKSVVYLGDPMQLEQPQQGSHPPGVDVSPLDHLLNSETTMPWSQGLFMPETRRLHPAICAYTSEVFYEGKLRSMPGLERQALVDCGPFDGAGLRVVPVPHEGNQSSSVEEAEAIAELYAGLLRGRWCNEKGTLAPITPNEILIVTPYNAQVSLLGARLPDARIGTVDKFQGQEAPVVIYSMATSSPEGAPRGMEFLYSANRLNVATSRARCAAIVVASPRLFEVECKTPGQMRLANALARLGLTTDGARHHQVPRAAAGPTPPRTIRPTAITPSAPTT
jgi:predicted RecB family nuclease